MSKSSRRQNRENRKSTAGHRLNRNERRRLKQKRQINLSILRSEKNATGSKIEPRTQARNCKSSASNLVEQRQEYEDVVEAHLDTCRTILPSLINKFSKIDDPRNPKKIKHKITVLMLFGLILFLFRVESRRSFNQNLTQPSVLEIIHKFFPEIDSIPHADTIGRLLEKIDPLEIEKIHISMLKKLIKNKKFNKFLIQGCFPISIDGTQKATRNGQLQEDGWLLRTIRTKKGEEFQQYVFIVEANITFANGLNVPLLTEYCYLNADDLSDENFRQDCELKAFARLADRLKKYFPRLKIIIFLDNLYACNTVIANLKCKNWEFMIKLPYKLKNLCELLEAHRDTEVNIPNQLFYREREQSFYWLNNVDNCGVSINLVCCVEKWKSVSDTTGDQVLIKSEHRWISSIPLSFDNLHQLCNLGARKRAYIEDNFNTEKNRGYRYKHIFSYDWNAMQGFHRMMRLAHAINALSEFTRKMKKYIRDLGWSNVMRKIFDAIRHCYLSDSWAKKQLKKTPQLRFDFCSS